MNDKSKLRINKKDVLMTQHLGKWTDTKQDEMLSWCGLVTGEKSHLAAGWRAVGGLDWTGPMVTAVSPAACRRAETDSNM